MISYRINRQIQQNGLDICILSSCCTRSTFNLCCSEDGFTPHASSDPFLLFKIKKKKIFWQILALQQEPVRTIEVHEFGHCQIGFRPPFYVE